MLLHPLRIILSVNRLSSDFSIKTVALILDAHRVLANVPILEMKMAVKMARYRAGWALLRSFGYPKKYK